MRPCRRTASVVKTSNQNRKSIRGATDATNSCDPRATISRAEANQPTIGELVGLKAAQDSAQIIKRLMLQPVAIPTLPESFSTILEKALVDISKDAAERVFAHLEKHSFHSEGEEWLQKGLEHVADGACPFCEKPLAENKLVDAYQSYFSEAYATFKSNMVTLRAAVVDAVSTTVGMVLVQTLKDTTQELLFWKSYIEPDFEFPDTGTRILEILDTLSCAALARVDKKIAAPLEPLGEAPAFDNASAAWSNVTNTLTLHNEFMQKFNTQIQKMKDGLDKKDQAAIEGELAQYKTIQARHADPVSSLTKDYAKLLKEKRDLVTAKDSKKAELDAYDEAVLAAYEADINKILVQFGASFKLTNWNKSYVGKVPQSGYCIQFDDATVDVSAKGGDGSPCFRTTMSAGDKSTLALAFFLAQITRDAEISKKIVVFDDPFSSLDDFRREMTAKNVVRCGEKATQVIVLSHDKYFLDVVRRKIHGAGCVPMQISCTRGNSSLEPWDIEREVRDGYLQDHMALVEFSEGLTSDAKVARMLMRPLLEKYIRYRFPNQIDDGKWLGDMCSIIREDTAHPLQHFYNDLDDINQYTAPFHHDPDAPFNPDEVMNYVKRTLAIVGGA